MPEARSRESSARVRLFRLELSCISLTGSGEVSSVVAGSNFMSSYTLSRCKSSSERSCGQLSMRNC